MLQFQCPSHFLCYSPLLRYPPLSPLLQVTSTEDMKSQCHKIICSSNMTTVLSFLVLLNKTNKTVDELGLRWYPLHPWHGEQINICHNTNHLKETLLQRVASELPCESESHGNSLAISPAVFQMWLF